MTTPIWPDNRELVAIRDRLSVMANALQAGDHAGGSRERWQAIEDLRRAASYVNDASLCVYYEEDNHPKPLG